MRVLVTGGAGFIGSHMAEALLARGHAVRILDGLMPPVHPRRVKPWIPPGARFLRGDVRKRRDWEAALDGVEAVYHFAPYQDYLPDFSTFFHVNVVGTALLYEVAVRRRLRLRKVVVASSQAVYGEGRYRHDLVREAMRKAGVIAGVEITTLADVPSEGSGLGSSSSVTVGLLNALYIYQGIQQTAETLARQACEIEIDALKRPIGKQDQYIAAYGGLRHLTFQRDGDVTVKAVGLPAPLRRELENHLMLFFTRRTRRAETILSEQHARVADNLTVLQSMREQVREFRAALERGDFVEAGRVLHDGWRLKKRLASQITNPELDALYARALSAGALGGKIAGAGGGGFLLLLCPVQNQGRVREELADLRDLPFHLEPDGSKVIFNNRRYVWK